MLRAFAERYATIFSADITLLRCHAIIAEYDFSVYAIAARCYARCAADYAAMFALRHFEIIDASYAAAASAVFLLQSAP